jgi:UDP-N-acetyl-D-galactosamine dehydrogenase
MGAFVARCVDKELGRGSRVLVLGLTFKENIPDLRNSKVADIIGELRRLGHDVTVHDPFADAGEAMEHYGIALARELDDVGRFDALVGAVAHAVFKAFTAEVFESLLNPGGLIADVKAIWRGVEFPAGVRRWEL